MEAAVSLLSTFIVSPPVLLGSKLCFLVPHGRWLPGPAGFKFICSFIRSFILLCPCSVPGIWGAARWQRAAFGSGSWHHGPGHLYCLYVT